MARLASNNEVRVSGERENTQSLVESMPIPGIVIRPANGSLTKLQRQGPRAEAARRYGCRD